MKQLEIKLKDSEYLVSESGNRSILPNKKYAISARVMGIKGQPYSACLGVISFNKSGHELNRKVSWLNDFSGEEKIVKIFFDAIQFCDHIRIIYRINIETPNKSSCQYNITDPNDIEIYEINDQSESIHDIELNQIHTVLNSKSDSLVLKPKKEWSSSRLQEEADKIRWWLKMPLASGVMTKGQMSVLELLPHLGIPEDLRGKRVLDIGCSDGFFSFLAEQRGAEVVAIDPFPFRGFQFAHDVLGSNVQFHRMGVYDVSPEKLGTFDIVFFLGVYYHLKHPTLAMERIASVTKEFAIVESAILASSNIDKMPVSEYLETEKPGNDESQYFIPTVDFLMRTIRGGGFPRVELVSRFFHSQRGNRAVVRGYKSSMTSKKILSESIHVGITDPKPYSIHRVGKMNIEGSIVDDSTTNEDTVKNVQIYIDGLPSEGLFLGDADIIHLPSSKSESWDLPSHRYKLNFDLPQMSIGKHLLYIVAYTCSAWNFHSVPIIVE